MTRPDGTPDPGAPESDDEEAVEAELVEESPVAPEAGAVTDISDPDGETDRLRSELEERTGDLQRVSAEYANYRRRVERDRKATVEAAKGSVLGELLPLVDDLERARAHGDLEEGPLKVFADKLQGLLTAQGVEQFGEEGDAFDPSLHEAVQDESSGGDQVLGTVLRKGYRLGDRTLRTAMVIVTTA